MSIYTEKYPATFEKGKRETREFLTEWEAKKLAEYKQDASQMLQDIKHSVETGLCDNGITPLDETQQRILEESCAYYEGVLSCFDPA